MEHMFIHSVQNLLNPVCNCELDIESPLRYLLHYLTYNSERHILLRTLKNIDNNLSDLTKPILTTILLFGCDSCHISTNTNIQNMIMNLVYLLKDWINRFFNEFIDCCRNELLNKKLKKFFIYLTSNKIIILNLLF